MQAVLGKVRKAVKQYDMIKSGDRIAVGVSGGKDSLVLLAALKRLSMFYPESFTVCGITVDPCFDGKKCDFSVIEDYCRKTGIQYVVERTEIWNIVFGERKESNPCSLCSRMRKGALYNTAQRLGCNKVALGHHIDDAAATFYMNLVNSGTLWCFSPVSEIAEKGITLIRPLILTDERNIIHAAKAERMPVIKSGCPMDGHTVRADTEKFLSVLDKEYRGIKQKTVSAMQKAHLCGW